MAAAALGAAVFVFRNPRLRRMAWQLARQYAGAPLAAMVATTVRDAWDASAPRTGEELRRSRDATPRTGEALPRSVDASGSALPDAGRALDARIAAAKRVGG